jgi:glycosyltransferase involved in cell wall biosynthesis
LNDGRIRVLLDDVFFSISRDGIARFWLEMLSSFLHDQQKIKKYEFIILNRTDALNGFGCKSVVFPEHSFQFPAVDREMISKVIKQYSIDVFASTYHTFSLDVPNIVVLHDFIPEIFNYERESRGWLERLLTIATGDVLAAVSVNTAYDYTRFIKNTGSLDKIPIIRPGINPSVFKPADKELIQSFRNRYGLKKFAVMVGSRGQKRGYKNGDLVLRTALMIPEWNLDLVFVGGEPISPETKYAFEKKGIKLIRLELSDEELCICLSSAECLIYTSLYEGFGFPPLEAQSCGTPVVSTVHGALHENSTEWSIRISGLDEFELWDAIQTSQLADHKHYLAKQPSLVGEKYNWEKTADTFAQLIDLAYSERSNSKFLDKKVKLMEYNSRMTYLQR